MCHSWSPVWDFGMDHVSNTDWNHCNKMVGDCIVTMYLRFLIWQYDTKLITPTHWALFFMQDRRIFCATSIQCLYKIRQNENKISTQIDQKKHRLAEKNIAHRNHSRTKFRIQLSTWRKDNHFDSITTTTWNKFDQLRDLRLVRRNTIFHDRS